MLGLLYTLRNIIYHYHSTTAYFFDPPCMYQSINSKFGTRRRGYYRHMGLVRVMCVVMDWQRCRGRWRVRWAVSAAASSCRG